VGTAYGLVLSDDYLYVAVASYGIKIYNIASPANPQFVSSLYTSTGSYPLLEKDGDYLYLASYSSGHKVIDVSNVNNPVLVNSVNPISLDQQISLSNGLLFTGNWYGGIYMYDFTNINNPVLLCNTPSLSNGTFDVDVAGPYLYVADLACFRTMGYQTNRDGYYRWMLSEYEWEDIIVNGTPWPAGDDTFTDIIPIGFDFPFYDHSYDSLYACSNGFIAFNNYSPSYWNTPIPCNTQPNNIIAPLWDNFDVTGCPSRIYTQYFDNPERFVIEYFEVPRVGTGEFETFEIILYPDGNIKFQYPNIVNSRSVTIGVENETGSRGNLVTHNPHRTIPDSTAVIFYRLDSLEPGMGSPELSRGAITDRVEFLNAAPNPFNAETTISFQLNRACEVALTVYDVRGCVTASLAEGSLAAGYYSYRFDAGNLSSGIYFARLTAGKETKTQRLLLVK